MALRANNSSCGLNYQRDPEGICQICQLSPPPSRIYLFMWIVCYLLRMDLRLEQCLNTLLPSLRLPGFKNGIAMHGSFHIIYDIPILFKSPNIHNMFKSPNIHNLLYLQRSRPPSGRKPTSHGTSQVRQTWAGRGWDPPAVSAETITMVI